MKTANITAEEITEQLHGNSLILDNPKVIPTATSDTPDNYVLAAAQAAGAEFIVTGDKLLLALKRYENIPIISPQRFLRSYSK